MDQPGQSHSTSAPSGLAAGATSAAWRIALPVVVLVLALILVLYRDTAVAMVIIWYRSETFAHAFVVPPIVLWLIWRKRQELGALMPTPAPWVLLAVAGIALLWLLGDLVAVNSVTQLALTALVVLTVPALLGLQVARAIAFPLAFLFFAVPIGEFMLPQLMEWTANFTIIALRMSGIPVYREGLQFVIPSGNWSVVEACSGVRYLIASLTVGTLFAYLNYQSIKRRVLFIIVSILVPILANWMRAYMIVMLGHFSSNKLATGVDHLIYGWVFFGVVIMLMFVVGARWSEPEKSFDSDAPSPYMRPIKSPTYVHWIVTIALVAVVTLPTLAKSIIDHGTASGKPVLAAPAALEAGWKKLEARTIGFKPAFENPSAEINAIYVSAEKLVGVYVGYYRNQDYGRKLVSSNNVVVTLQNTDWSRTAGSARLTRAGGESAEVRVTELRRLGGETSERPERLVVWQIYWINGTLTASDYLAKVYSAAYRLMGRGDDSAVIMVYSAKGPTGGADATLDVFMTANYGAIDALLRQARASK